MFGVVWARWQGPGFCSTSSLVRSVCFPFVIKQGCVACKVVVSACGLTMSHKVTMTCIIVFLSLKHCCALLDEKDKDTSKSTQSDQVNRLLLEITRPALWLLIFLSGFPRALG